MARRRETYYDDRNKKIKNKKKRRNSFFDYVIFAVTVIVIVGVLLSWAARWINPSTYGVMASLGLLMPVLFTANFICLLYWAIRWKKMAFAPLAVLIVFSWGVSMFFKPRFTQSYSDNARDRSLVSVMTYNVRGMMEEVNHEEGSFVSSMDKIASAIDSIKPGILCIQEFQSTRNYSRTYFQDKIPSLHYRSVRYNIGGDDDLGWGLAIYSRYPIARTGHLDFHGTSNSIIWADIAVNSDTVRVFNAHLQTTSITASDQEYIVNMNFVTDETRSSQVKRMVGKLRDNYVIRAGQADTLALNIESSPYPVIVCGDFNDTPVSYTYRKVSNGLKDSFREAGSGYGYSYRGFFNLLRIDYILHSKRIECVDYLSPKFEYSDHNPVTVRLKIKPEK